MNSCTSINFVSDLVTAAESSNMKMVLENGRLVSGFLHDQGDKDVFLDKALNTDSNEVFCCQPGKKIFATMYNINCTFIET